MKERIDSFRYFRGITFHQSTPIWIGGRIGIFRSPGVSTREVDTTFILNNGELGGSYGTTLPWSFKMVNNFKYFRGIEPSLGYRGRTFMEPGYVYAPYIPIMTTARVEDNINPSQMIGSRYTTRMVNNSFYETININLEE